MKAHIHSKSNKKSGFSADVMKLTTGTAFAQGLSVLAAPIVARLYAPEAFGISALFISISGIMSVIACMRYEFSIVLPESDEEAANLLGASLFFVALISTLTFLLLWLFKEFIIGILRAQELNSFFWLIPLAVFFEWYI